MSRFPSMVAGIASSVSTTERTASAVIHGLKAASLPASSSRNSMPASPPRRCFASSWVRRRPADFNGVLHHWELHGAGFADSKVGHDTDSERSRGNVAAASAKSPRTRPCSSERDKSSTTARDRLSNENFCSTESSSCTSCTLLIRRWKPQSAVIQGRVCSRLP